MPSKRLYVPLEGETLLAVEALAKVRGCGAARVCADILDDTAPIMLEMAKALTVAKEAPARAVRDLCDQVDRQIADLDQLRLDMEPKVVRKKRKKK